METNPVLQALFNRRSVRAFLDRPVAPELVNDLLQAAMAAPSAVARDPWHFVVITEGATRSAIAALLPNGKMLSHSPVGIVVCGDLEQAHAGELSYLLQDCSAAIENLLLAASMLGLGACWLGVHPRPERVGGLRQLFDLPENIVPVSVIAVGWPVDTPPPRTRFRDSAIHYGGW